jgi:hypothetical protein
MPKVSYISCNTSRLLTAFLLDLLDLRDRRRRARSGVVGLSYGQVIGRDRVERVEGQSIEYCHNTQQHGLPWGDVSNQHMHNLRIEVDTTERKHCFRFHLEYPESGQRVCLHTYSLDLGLDLRYRWEMDIAHTKKLVFYKILVWD